jgi:ABC-2 type transport system permease protein
MASESAISSTGAPKVARVRVPGAGLLSDLRAIRVVWLRELIRFSRDRARMITSLVQPVLFLFVLGTGLSRLASSGTHGVNLRTFVYPGVLAMAVLFTAMFSAASIVWDREFGFLREMLVAPVRRSALVLGKCLGGATVATCQGAVMLVFAGFVHVPYSPSLLLALVGIMALLSFTLTAFGSLIASRIAQVESFQVVMNFLVLPMFFLSGAVFPLDKLPTWLSWLTKIDPLSYAVDPMRRVVFDHVSVSPRVARVLNPGMTWGGWRLPLSLELGMVAVLGALMLVFAVVQFSRPE